MNRLNMNFLGGQPTMMEQEAPIPNNIQKPELLTKNNDRIVKSRFANNRKYKEDSDDEDDVNQVIRNIIKKKPSVRKLRKKMKFLVEAMEEDSDSDF